MYEKDYIVFKVNFAAMLLSFVLLFSCSSTRCISCTFCTFVQPSNIVDARNLPIYWNYGLNNNIRVIVFDGKLKYFKECKKKLSINGEVERIINDFFSEYLTDYYFRDKLLLSKALRNRNNFEKFINSGFLWDKKSSLSKYSRGEIDSSELGVPADVAKKLNVKLRAFFLYSSRELVQRCISSNIEEGDYQTNLAAKQLATYKLAKYLGIDDVVVKSEFVRLITDGGEKIGVITDKANGEELPRLQNKNLKIHPNFQLELTNLQILDTITNEQDHSPLNCVFKVKDGQIIGVMAFDNERSFGLNKDLKKGLIWGKISPILNEDNKLNLPHMSKKLSEKILNTTDKDIDIIFNDILSNDQINSFKIRFNKLKNAIIDKAKNDKEFLLSDEQWSDDTLREELSGIYGNTYLVYFLSQFKAYKAIQ